MQFCRWIDPLSLQQNQCHAWKIWHHSRKIVAIPENWRHSRKIDVVPEKLASSRKIDVIPQKINVIPAKAGIPSTRMKPH
jgi:hypothetical protein